MTTSHGREHIITKRAEDSTLTIAELRRFLTEYDKAVSDIAITLPDGVTATIPDWYGKVKARVSFSGGIKSISVILPD